MGNGFLFSAECCKGMILASVFVQISINWRIFPSFLRKGHPAVSKSLSTNHLRKDTLVPRARRSAGPESAVKSTVRATVSEMRFSESLDFGFAAIRVHPRF